MDLRRLRAGEWTVAAAGLVLVVTLFLPWYRADRPSAEGGSATTLTAWEAYSVLDIVLLVLGLLAVGLLVLTAVQRTAAVAVAADALLAPVAGVVAALTAARVLDMPAAIEVAASGPLEPARTAFAWIGLLAVLGVLAGTLLAMRDERLSGPGGRTDATGVPVEEPPEVERLPAPPLV
ncbi:MAG: hypothetical protein ACR2GL_04295 [Thermoleophilaceae bacterium]